jgi:anti-sigma B factor antagonist
MSMSRLEIKVRRSEDAGILELHGRLTMGDGDLALREAVAGMIAEGMQTVVLNVRNLDYSDSAGIGEMIAATMSLAQGQGELKIADPSPKIRDLLGRFPHNLNVVDTEEEALRS